MFIEESLLFLIYYHSSRIGYTDYIYESSLIKNSMIRSRTKLDALRK